MENLKGWLKWVLTIIVLSCFGVFSESGLHWFSISELPSTVISILGLIPIILFCCACSYVSDKNKENKNKFLLFVCKLYLILGFSFIVFFPIFDYISQLWRRL